MDEILSQTKVNTFFNVTIYVIDFVTIVLFLRIYIFQKQLPVDVFKISVFKNFAIFKGKHPCWSLFLKKLQA